MSDFEKLAAEVHGVYCEAYQKRFGKPYWTGGDYSKLDEPTKDYDRNLVRWHKARVDVFESDLAQARRELAEARARVAEWSKAYTALEVFYLKENSALRADNARMREALKSVKTMADHMRAQRIADMELEFVDKALTPDPGWLQRHDAEKDRRIAELVGQLEDFIGAAVAAGWSEEIGLVPIARKALASQDKP